MIIKFKCKVCGGTEAREYIDRRAPEKYKRQIIRAAIVLREIERRFFSAIYQGGSEARRQQIAARAAIRQAQRQQEAAERGRA